MLFTGVWAILLTLNLCCSRDYGVYRVSYDHLHNHIAAGSFPSDWLRDPGYLILQAIFASTPLPFEIFLGFVIALCLFLKWTALCELISKPVLLHAIPYLLVLSFIHEGTQIRIAIALSVVSWSLVWWVQKKSLQSLLMLCFALSFHISVGVIFLLYLVAWLADKYGKLVFIFATILAVICAYPGFLQTLFLEVGALLDARYMVYSRGAIYKSLNVTGLFQYFFIFVSLLTFIVYKFNQPRISEDKNFTSLAIISGVMGVVTLIDLRFNSVVASRLADILLLPVVMSLGIVLYKLKSTKPQVYSFILILLLGYCVIRGYTVFSPRPLAPLPTIE